MNEKINVEKSAEEKETIEQEKKKFMKWLLIQPPLFPSIDKIFDTGVRFPQQNVIHIE